MASQNNGQIVFTINIFLFLGTVALIGYGIYIDQSLPSEVLLSGLVTTSAYARCKKASETLKVDIIVTALSACATMFLILSYWRSLN